MSRLWLVIAGVALTAAPTLSYASGQAAWPSVEAKAGVAVEGRIEEAHFVFQPIPQYPPAAVNAGLQGRAHLLVRVNKDGSVQDLKVVSGEPTLVKAALEAVSRWHYKPILVAGKPVEVSGEIYITFRLLKRHR